jgi:hypothetical protein
LAAGALGLAISAAGLHWGAMVAGGADSYGYLSQAGLWRQGRLIVHQDLVDSSPWPDAAETWSPLGYRPSPHQRDAIVPIYAPGLPLLMALFQAVGGYCAAFLVVPFSGALTVWLTFVLGRRVFGASGVALWGAILVATSPVFLYQLMNAMSDVPATALWTLALLLAVMRRPLGSGLATSAVILIRPNLLLLAAVPGVWLAVADRRSAVSFAAGVAPALAGIAWLNGALYESPFVSGYGTTGDLYSLGFFGTNVRQFASWIADVEPPIVAFAPLYFVAPRIFPEPKIRAARPLFGAALAVVIASYIFYRPFDAWWYLRFLLPMWPALMLLTAAVLTALARLWTGRFAPVVVAALAAALAFHGSRVAAERSVFDLGSGERRYIDVARFVASHTEPGAVMLSLQHSGSLRLYAGRLTLRYVVLDPQWLDRAVAHLQSIGRHPYFVLDGVEVDAFRRRFGAANRSGTLDWPPLATLSTVVSIYDPIHRASAAPLAIARTRGRGWLACERPQRSPTLGMTGSP